MSEDRRPRLPEEAFAPSSLVRHLGVDKVALACQVHELPTPSRLWIPRGEVRRSATIVLDGATVQVTVGPVGRTLWARTEWNPSRLTNPDGWETCPLRGWSDTVGVATQIVRRELRPVLSLDAWNVKRMDVARDFTTVHPDRFLVGLGSVPRTYAKTMVLYRSPRTGRPQTLEVGVGGAGKVRLYDKHQERRDAPRGLLRFELEARGWLGSIARVRRVIDATPSTLSSLFEDRWRWSGMSASVVGPSTVALAIESLKIPESRKERMLGRLVRMSTPGVDVSDSGLDADIRRFLNEFGIVPTPQWDPLCEEPPGIRLDLALGREVTEHGPAEAAPSDRLKPTDDDAAPSRPP